MHIWFIHCSGAVPLPQCHLMTISLLDVLWLKLYILYCSLLLLIKFISYFHYHFTPKCINLGYEPYYLSSGSQALNRLENNSRTVKGALTICQDNEALALILLPLKKWSQGSQNTCRWNFCSLPYYFCLLLFFEPGYTSRKY